MAPCHRFVIVALVLGPVLASCREVTSPGIEGRWAATGIELTAQPSSAELRLLCAAPAQLRSEEHTSELQSRLHLVCRLLLEKKKKLHSTRAPARTAPSD